MRYLTLSLLLNSSFDDPDLKSFAFGTILNNLVEFRSFLLKIRGLIDEWIVESENVQMMVSNARANGDILK